MHMLAEGDTLFLRYERRRDENDAIDTLVIPRRATLTVVTRLWRGARRVQCRLLRSQQHRAPLLLSRSHGVMTRPGGREFAAGLGGPSAGDGDDAVAGIRQLCAVLVARRSRCFPRDRAQR